MPATPPPVMTLMTPTPDEPWPEETDAALPDGLSPVEDDEIEIAPTPPISEAGDEDEDDAIGQADTVEDDHIDAGPLAQRPGYLSVEEARRWQFELIGLLGKLESLRGQLAGCRYATDAEHVLEVGEAMVQLTEELAARHDFPENSLDTQMATLAKAGAFYATLNDVRRPSTAQRSLLKSVFARPTEDAVPAVAVRECLHQGIDSLHAYFSLFTEMYRSTTKARPWVDAASAFLADFKQMAREMPEE